jgi:ribosomal protein S24E
MTTQDLKDLYNKYGLTPDDVYSHKHYKIITRQGIDKIQAKAKIFISYEAVKVEPEYCVVKAMAKKDDASIETFGSAKYGAKTWDDAKKKWNELGNTTTWYVMEMAEKRAMSRAVLKITGFYELGFFGEDESEDFKKTSAPVTQTLSKPVDYTRQITRLESCDSIEQLAKVFASFTPAEKTATNNTKELMKKKLL